MKNSELIEELKKLPKEAIIGIGIRVCREPDYEEVDKTYESIDKIEFVNDFDTGKFVNLIATYYTGELNEKD